MTLTWIKCGPKDKKKFSLLLFRQVMRACNNPDSFLYRWYGKIGVKCLFTSALEIEYLYRHDHAYEMRVPCLGRRKWNGDFSRENCFFRESEADVRAEFKRLDKKEVKKYRAWIKRQEKRQELLLKKKLAKQQAKQN